MRPRGEAFALSFPIRSIDDVRRLEETPFPHALTTRSTYEILCNSAQAFSEKTALTFLHSGDPTVEPTCWSFAQLLTGVHQTANLLHALGVGPADTVAVLLPGCLEYHLALWGAEAAGIVQPLNPLLTDQTLVSMMRSARTKVLFAYGSDAESGIWSKAMRIRGEVPSLTTVLRVATHDVVADATGGLPAGVLDFNDERLREASGRLASGRDIAPSDIAAFFHTGGTTGSPKLARHRHGAQVFTAWATVKLRGMTPEDVTINGYPLFHVAGALVVSLTSLSAGAEIIIPTPSLLRNPEVVANYWRLVEKYRATTLSAVPTALAALANVPLGGADISSIRDCRTGAAPITQELATRFEQQFGLHVHENYGMTEMAGSSTIRPPGVKAPAGCVGFRLPYARLRIVALDESGGATDRDLPPGEQGMVLFKSPNVFAGFLDPADNASVFTADGWLATGDLGWLDDEGRLHLTGRAKDLIIRSGHNIDPKMLEDALAAHPAIEVCAAVGAPDAYAGELPVLFATIVRGTATSEAELLAFAAARVDEPPAKPRSVTIIEKMPMTTVGKIYKPELRLMAACAVISAVVADVWREAGLPEKARPKVEADAGRQTVRVTVRSAAMGADARALERLRLALARVPFKCELRSGA